MRNFIIILAIMSILISIFTATKQGYLLPGIMVGIVFFFTGLIGYGIWHLIAKSSPKVAKKIKEKANNIISGNTTNKSYYAIAEQEVDSQNVDSGLWAKALVNAKGNEEVRKAEYIKLRAKQLQKDSQ